MTRTDHITVFRGAAGSEPFASDELVLQAWSEADWNRLFEHTQTRPYRASEVVIQRSAVDRALYLVAAGSLEVGINQVDGVSMSTLAQIHAGSVVGEQSFFDGLPRSANVWGVSDGELLRLDLEDFRRFGTAEPGLARDLLFALGRVLSSRLRNTTMRVRR